VETSRHKLERLLAILEENQRANTIIVYNYEEERDALIRTYPQAALVTDDGAIQRWNAGLVETLLVHPKSAGHGLNLQSGGSTIVFYSLPWSLELYEQTIGRIHRGGQTRPCWVYCLITKGTIEERIWKALQDKRSVSDAALEELK
jgi:SNF2 family DNA or RNA helicase